MVDPGIVVQKKTDETSVKTTELSNCPLNSKNDFNKIIKKLNKVLHGSITDITTAYKEGYIHMEEDGTAVLDNRDGRLAQLGIKPKQAKVGLGKAFREIR